MTNDSTTSRPCTRGYVLIVDDDDDARELLARHVRLGGHRVVTACDGQQALDLLDEGAPTPGLILLDLEMPNVDGRAFLDARAQRPELSAVPVILVSGSDDAEDLRREYSIAAVHRKPIRPTRLTAQLTDVLEATPTSVDHGVAPLEAVIGVSPPPALSLGTMAGAVADDAAPRLVEPPDPTSIPSPTGESEPA